MIPRRNFLLQRVDGGEQFFTRDMIRLFEKPEETLINGIKKNSSDVVWVIRKFQPDL